MWLTFPPFSLSRCELRNKSALQQHIDATNAPMDLNDAPLFVRIVQLGSFAAAAAELGVQRSSVSRSVARLEESLGVRLLQRTTRQLSLTDAGQVFFDQVQGAVASLDDAVNAVREFGGEPRGSARALARRTAARSFGRAHQARHGRR
jgi:DNA-binding transcriptional LysR family regulator